MNRLLSKVAVLGFVMAFSTASASFTWTGVDINTYAGLDVRTGLGIPTKVATFGVEAGASATFNQMSMASNYRGLTQDDFLKDRTILDGAEIRVGLVAREIKIPTTDIEGYLGAGISYSFNKIYGVYDDINSGKINLGGTDPLTPGGQQKAIEIAQQRILDDLSPYFEGGAMGKIWGPLGWRAGIKMSSGFSAGAGIEIRF